MFTEEEKLALTCIAQTSRPYLISSDGMIQRKRRVDTCRHIPDVGALAWGSRQGGPETPCYRQMMLFVLAAYPE